MGAMAELKDLEAAMAGHLNLGKGHIYLGIVSTTKYFVPMLLVEFQKICPGIGITLKIDNRENILQMLARNEVDLVIMGRAPKDMTASPHLLPLIQWASSAAPHTLFHAESKCLLRI